uniref:Uncharacterized protein n=1 Tax=Chromera velia CCMP2878 TaxID=1169474 RepID=A0A0G4I5D1_9ALVE|eukprot:Cvel_11134.t1-p1 / transcript=Cvel_11134.t1 / gene=Cvel_11134 / organism=Chromera_velia_CCMP2878 / gene_product=hypothetical protein / transcript_product=hypothetical protein / location=Cvel_scaffold690:25592-26104(-) / protein_length=171 / sequence_SO=supercontig / SO=protein_coding / is_pseudo=false
MVVELSDDESPPKTPQQSPLFYPEATEKVEEKSPLRPPPWRCSRLSSCFAPAGFKMEELSPSAHGPAGFKMEELLPSARGPLFLEDENEDKDKDNIAGPGFRYETPPRRGEQEKDASEEEFGGEEEEGYSDEEDMSEEEEEGGRRGGGKPRRATVERMRECRKNKKNNPQA